MTDVSSTIVAGDWVLVQIGDKLIRIANPYACTASMLASDARDLWQVLNVWIERTAKEAE